MRSNPSSFVFLFLVSPTFTLLHHVLSARLQALSLAVPLARSFPRCPQFLQALTPVPPPWPPHLEVRSP